MHDLSEIVGKSEFDIEDLIRMLGCSKSEEDILFDAAEKVRLSNLGNKVYGRALIELTNYCKKDCYYCGIRKSNHEVERYILPFEQVQNAINLAIDSGIGSLAIQSGELSSNEFTNYIIQILNYAKEKDPSVSITLSCGEQSYETYKKWFDAGAERYLLRIEVSDENIYYNFHPDNDLHSFKNRLLCLKNIRKIGYQTGTGIMIGLPGQTIESLANDVLFMKELDIHMCGMGPFIPCLGTPMQTAISPFSDVLNMSLRMIAVLRIVMQDINIVASTAMETVHPLGRTFAIKAGANVIMPNINPLEHRKKYKLYEKIPTNVLDSTMAILEAANKPIPEGYKLELNTKGTSPHYLKEIYY